MSVPRSIRLLTLAATATGILVLVNCGDIAPNLGSGARCSLNSDCKSPLVCGFERCRPECKTSRDCNGKLCVRSDLGGNVCQLDDEVACTRNSECPGTQICGPDRHCRDVCITDKDCVTDLLCVSRTCAKKEELVDGKLPEASPSTSGVTCTYATDCPGTLVCLGGRCDLECLGDKDCLVGWSCKPQAGGGDGRCYPNAAAPVDGGMDVAVSDASDAAPEASTNDGGDAGSATDASDGGGSTLTLASFGRFSVGVQHACALLTGDKLKCWGVGAGGALGYGDPQTRGDGPGEMGDNLPFVNLGTGVTVSKVFAGTGTTCAVFADGRLKCWGYNYDGRLGYGDAINRGDQPNQMGDNLPYVNLGAGRTAKSAALGQAGVVCAILDNDTLKCWGYNGEGQLGQGDVMGRGQQANDMGDNLPAISLGAARTVKSVSVGGSHVCAVLDNGKVKCWGDNGSGQLGYGNTMNRGNLPNQMGDNLPTVDLGTGRTAKAVAAGLSTTCAILDNGQVKCWGNGANGPLGYGDNTPRGDNAGEMGDALPAIDLGTGRTAKSMVPFLGTRVCVVLDNDQVKCWGNNFNGGLGYGDSQNRGALPNQMGDNLPFVQLGTGRSALAVFSFGMTCAVLDNDTIKCWGRNVEGQLGLGDTLNRGDLPNQMGDNLPTVKLVGP